MKRTATPNLRSAHQGDQLSTNLAYRIYGPDPMTGRWRVDFKARSQPGSQAIAWATTERRAQSAIADHESLRIRNVAAMLHVAIAVCSGVVFATIASDDFAGLSGYLVAMAMFALAMRSVAAALRIKGCDMWGYRPSAIRRHTAMERLGAYVVHHTAVGEPPAASPSPGGVRVLPPPTTTPFQLG